MIIKHKLDIDLSQRGCDPIIHISQGDAGSHEILFRITKNRQRWRPPAGLSVLVHYSNSFHSGGTYDTLPDGNPAWKLSRDCLSITLIPEIMALPGSVHVVVTLLHGGTALSAFHLRLMVQGLATAASPVLTNYSNITGFLPAPDSAKEGQFFTAEAVSDSGKVISVSAVDAPTGGGNTESGRMPTASVMQTDNGATITLTDKNGTTTATISNGKDGKTAYAYAVENGYTDTENAFGTKLAEEFPPTLPNPSALTINGQAYDGSSALEVDTREFVVNVTDNGDSTYTSDYYFADIKTAYNSGRTPVAVMNNYRYPLIYAGNMMPQGFRFAAVLGNTLTAINIKNIVQVSKTVLATPDDIPDVSAVSTDPFILHTAHEENEDGTIPIMGYVMGDTTAETTSLEECLDAYLHGKKVLLQINTGEFAGCVFPCTYCDGVEAYFEQSLGFYGILAYVIDGLVEFAAFEIPEMLPNPNPLTIGGISYDGSSPVDMTQTIQNMISKKISSIPDALKNPHKLTFTGAVSGEYDGSEAVTIEIPSGGAADTETVLSDNLLDPSLLTKGGVWYYGSSNYQLAGSSESYSYYGFIPLRGAGTYRTKFQAGVHSSTGTRIALADDNNQFVVNATGTLGEVTDDNNWVDFEFVVTTEMISSGVTKVVFDVYSLFVDQTMIVKDREYPSEYIPYGYIEVATDSGKKQDNILCGKTAVFLGDSICAGTTVGTDSEYYGFGWAGLIGEANRMNWTNYGKNGGTITHRGTDGTCIATIAATAISEHPAADYIIFEGGCNDADQMREAGLGVISSDYATFDTATFSGALENLILKLVTAYPHAKIGYVIPQKMYTGYANYTAESHIHRKYFDRAVEICRKWGIPVMDLWNENPLNPKLPTASLFYVEENGQHLTLAGYQRITPQIEAFMRSL